MFSKNVWSTYRYQRITELRLLFPFPNSEIDILWFVTFVRNSLVILLTRFHTVRKFNTLFSVSLSFVNAHPTYDLWSLNQRSTSREYSNKSISYAGSAKRHKLGSKIRLQLFYVISIFTMFVVYNMRWSLARTVGRWFRCRLVSF